MIIARTRSSMQMWSSIRVQVERHRPTERLSKDLKTYSLDRPTEQGEPFQRRRPTQIIMTFYFRFFFKASAHCCRKQLRQEVK